MSGEATSLSDIALPHGQEELLQALVATGKPVVLVLMNGRPMTLTWEAGHCAAILETWFGGIEAGNAIAGVLFGDYNPSGKLSATFPRTVGQIPIYYNHKNTGRPYQGDPRSKFVSRYLDVPNDPLYPFGFGLSYTTFSYGPVKLSQAQLTGNPTLLASVTVANTGNRAGEETVKWNLTQPAGQRDPQRRGPPGIPKSAVAAGRIQGSHVPHHPRRPEILQRPVEIRLGTGGIHHPHRRQFQPVAVGHRPLEQIASAADW